MTKKKTETTDEGLVHEALAQADFNACLASQIKSEKDVK